MYKNTYILSHWLYVSVCFYRPRMRAVAKCLHFTSKDDRLIDRWPKYYKNACLFTYFSMSISKDNGLFINIYNICFYILSNIRLLLLLYWNALLQSGTELTNVFLFVKVCGLWSLSIEKIDIIIHLREYYKKTREKKWQKQQLHEQQQ